MYDTDFPAANHLLDDYLRAHPADPLGPTFRAASDLFSELNRLQILEGEFFADDKRIAEKKKLTPDPALRVNFEKNIAKARALAEQRLKEKSEDPDSLFALCISAGLVLDYSALIEKRQLMSLSYAKEANKYAVRLLKADPSYADAYMTTGFTEYLLGSLPFFLRWFVKFDDTTGDKSLAVPRLQKVIQSGKYLGPFAKILMSMVHLREKRFEDCERVLAELARDFPGNALFKKELAKVGELARKKAGPRR